MKQLYYLLNYKHTFIFQILCFHILPTIRSLVIYNISTTEVSGCNFVLLCAHMSYFALLLNLVMTDIFHSPSPFLPIFVFASLPFITSSVQFASTLVTNSGNSLGFSHTQAPELNVEGILLLLDHFVLL
jgi:hypothetical protein